MRVRDVMMVTLQFRGGGTVVCDPLWLRDNDFAIVVAFHACGERFGGWLDAGDFGAVGGEATRNADRPRSTPTSHRRRRIRGVWCWVVCKSAASTFSDDPPPPRRGGTRWRTRSLRDLGQHAPQPTSIVCTVDCADAGQGDRAVTVAVPTGSPPYGLWCVCCATETTGSTGLLLESRDNDEVTRALAASGNQTMRTMPGRRSTAASSNTC